MRVCAGGGAVPEHLLGGRGGGGGGGGRPGHLPQHGRHPGHAAEQGRHAGGAGASCEPRPDNYARKSQNIVSRKWNTIFKTGK